MRMIKQVLLKENDGFYGIWYPNSKRESHCGMILMIGDSSDGRMVCAGVKWVHGQGLHALSLSPEKKDLGRHNYPLESVERRLNPSELKARENRNLRGICNGDNCSSCSILLFGHPSYHSNDSCGFCHGGVL
ncbi:hypothetical protein [Treponema putidum]|uniref:hypothetical protein n=1 Tax=Treponema putidum TaxID=221027 RepID=UPI002103533E|nr:hypothetical protein [Treponema putidum]